MMKETRLEVRGWWIPSLWPNLCVWAVRREEGHSRAAHVRTRDAPCMVQKVCRS